MSKKEGGKTVSTHSYEVINWVIENFTEANKWAGEGKDIAAFKCPTPTHAATLLMAIQDPKNLVKFIDSKQKMEAIRAKKTKANQLMRDDQRTQFRFLDAVLAEMPVSYKTEKRVVKEACMAGNDQS